MSLTDSFTERDKDGARSVGVWEPRGHRAQGVPTERLQRQGHQRNLRISQGTILFRVTLVAEYLGWVDYDLVCSTIALL